MNFEDTFDRYHMKFLYDTNSSNIYSSDFHKYWKIYQKYINYLINKDLKKRYKKIYADFLINPYELSEISNILENRNELKKSEVDEDEYFSPRIDKSIQENRLSFNEKNDEYFEILNHIELSMKMLIRLLIKNNDDLLYKHIKTNFKKLLTYERIHLSIDKKLICKIDRYNINDFPKVFIDDLGIAFDNHNESLIQYIIYNYINNTIVPFLSRTLYTVDEILTTYTENGVIYCKKEQKMVVGMVMENIDGLEFKKILYRTKNPDTILNILMKIIYTIEYLQNKLDFLHNDLKPDNIILDKNGNIKIIDFGLSYIKFKQNHVFPNTLFDLELDKNINGRGDYVFDFIHFMNNEYKFSSDLMYLFLNMMYSLNRENPLYNVFEEHFFDFNGIKINRVMKEMGFNYTEFILSKEPELFNLHFPNIDLNEFYNRFNTFNLKNTLKYISNLILV